MKLESLVIVDDNATVNDMSDFAHTAHHIQRVFILKREYFFFLERRKMRILWYFTRVRTQKKEKNSKNQFEALHKINPFDSLVILFCVSCAVFFISTIDFPQIKKSIEKNNPCYNICGADLPNIKSSNCENKKNSISLPKNINFE